MLKYFLLASLIALSDQLTKALIIKNIIDDQFIRINSYFYLVHFKNEGAAFSFLSDAGGWQRYFLSIVAVIASVFIIFMIKKHRDELYMAIGLSLILGGAIGNLYDRISLGYVTDFLYFHYKDFYWPAFNIADTSISIGAAIIIYEIIIKKNKLDIE
ncbi:signal peptidase II [Methylophilaceae bacterium]|nr:signal peptidase II [Methylophilaceae bacterium]|tara:strand:- start:716 stop:1186 length:471 start_codon:yes stop_codon:yes gene_type:complete